MGYFYDTSGYVADMRRWAAFNMHCQGLELPSQLASPFGHWVRFSWAYGLPVPFSSSGFWEAQSFPVGRKWRLYFLHIVERHIVFNFCKIAFQSGQSLQVKKNFVVWEISELSRSGDITATGPVRAHQLCPSQQLPPTRWSQSQFPTSMPSSV